MFNTKLLKATGAIVATFAFFEYVYPLYENILGNFQKYNIEMHLPHSSVSFASMIEIGFSNNWPVIG